VQHLLRGIRGWTGYGTLTMSLSIPFNVYPGLVQKDAGTMPIARP
jgi:hypothetical protein